MVDVVRRVEVQAGPHFRERFTDPEVAANCFMWMLTPAYRVLEQWNGDQCVAYAVERFEREWFLPSGFTVYGNPSRVVTADRIICRHHAMIIPNGSYVEEYGEFLDERGVPHGSRLGTYEEPSQFATEGNDTTFHNEAWAMLDGADEDCSFERLAGDNWISITPDDSAGFQVTLEADDSLDEPKFVVLLADSAGCILPFQEALNTAGRIANGFGRVVETYVGKWFRSTVIECYREEGWVPVTVPVFANWLLAVLPPTRRRFLQMKVNVVAEFVPGPNYRLGEDGLPPDSHLGERWTNGWRA